MKDFTPAERRLTLALALISCCAAVVMVPEVRDVLGLERVDEQRSPAVPAVAVPGIATVSGMVAEPADESRLPANASASSVLPPSRVAAYAPANVLDDDPGSVWVENAPADVRGEWIRLTFDRERTLSRLVVVNGYPRGQRYLENARVQNATILLSDGTTRKIRLRDTHHVQEINLGGVRSRYVTLQIDNVYPGLRWDDTAIAELYAVGS